MSGTTSGVNFCPSAGTSCTGGGDVDMEIFRGKTLRFDIIWGGDAPIDITGYSVRLQARDHKGRLMLDLSTDNGGVSIDGPAGRMTFSASNVQTNAVDASGIYEVEMTTTSGDIYRVMSGRVRPVEEVVQ